MTLRNGASLTPPSPLRWIKHGLRHSFCSYRLAVVHDVARVALEAGNSSQMIFQHYRELITEEDGKAWFDTRPKNPLVVPSANSTPVSDPSKS